MYFDQVLGANQGIGKNMFFCLKKNYYYDDPNDNSQRKLSGEGDISENDILKKIQDRQL